MDRTQKPKATENQTTTIKASSPMRNLLVLMLVGMVTVVALVPPFMDAFVGSGDDSLSGRVSLIASANTQLDDQVVRTDVPLKSAADPLSGINFEEITKELEQIERDLADFQKELDNSVESQLNLVLAEGIGTLEKKRALLGQKASIARGNFPEDTTAPGDDAPASDRVVHNFERIQSLSSQNLVAERKLADAQRFYEESKAMVLALQEKKDALNDEINNLKKDLDRERKEKADPSVIQGIVRSRNERLEYRKEVEKELYTEQKNSLVQKFKVEEARLKIELLSASLEWKKRQTLDLVSDFLRSLYYRGIVLLPQIIFGLVVIVMFWYGGKVGRYLVKRSGKKRRAHHALFNLSATFVRVLFVFIGIVLALLIMGLGSVVTTLLAGLGLAGIAVGLAFQDVLKAFFAGVVISFEDPYDIGDQIQVGDHVGTVTTVQLRATTIQNYDNEKVIIPNSYILNENIINLTRLGLRRCMVEVGVAYDTDIEVAREAAVKAMDGLEFVANDPMPMVLSEAFGESSITLRCYFWFDPFEISIIKARSGVTEAVLGAFRGHDVTIPFPIRTLEFNAS